MPKHPNSIDGEMGGLIKIETITPVMARALLDRDSKNRPLKNKRINEYAADMRDGHWELNGETIKIAKNGDVLDGRNRLEACVLARTSFTTVMVYDLDPSTFKTIDYGSPRILSDLLSVNDVPDAKTVASSLVYVWYWDNAPDGERFQSQRLRPHQRPTRNQVFDWFEHKTRKELWPESTKAARALKGLCPRSIACAAHYIFSRVSRAKADEFFEKLRTGAGLASENDPVLQLRSRLFRDKTRKYPSPSMEKFGWVIKAWAAFLEGREIKQLRLQTKGKAEDFTALRTSFNKAEENDRPVH